MERTLIIIKPDGVARGLIGRIITRFEDKGLIFAGLKLMQVPRELAEKHYAIHRERPFFAELVGFITAGPVVVGCLQGPRAITVARKLMGKTFGFEAEPGTIRGDYGNSKQFNLIHGSDSPETASFEIGLYFAPAELCDYPHPIAHYIAQPAEA